MLILRPMLAKTFVTAEIVLKKCGVRLSSLLTLFIDHNQVYKTITIWLLQTWLNCGEWTVARSSSSVFGKSAASGRRGISRSCTSALARTGIIASAVSDADRSTIQQCPTTFFRLNIKINYKYITQWSPTTLEALTLTDKFDANSSLILWNMQTLNAPLFYARPPTSISLVA